MKEPGWGCKISPQWPEIDSTRYRSEDVDISFSSAKDNEDKCPIEIYRQKIATAVNNLAQYVSMRKFMVNTTCTTEEILSFNIAWMRHVIMLF